MQYGYITFSIIIVFKLYDSYFRLNFRLVNNSQHKPIELDLLLLARDIFLLDSLMHSYPSGLGMVINDKHHPILKEQNIRRDNFHHIE